MKMWVGRQQMRIYKEKWELGVGVEGGRGCSKERDNEHVDACQALFQGLKSSSPWILSSRQKQHLKSRMRCLGLITSATNTSHWCWCLQARISCLGGGIQNSYLFWCVCLFVCHRLFSFFCCLFQFSYCCWFSLFLVFYIYIEGIDHVISVTAVEGRVSYCRCQTQYTTATRAIEQP